MNLITQEHLDSFSDKLNRILLTELKRGNEVRETSKGWPQKTTIMVFMKRPFTQRYHLYEGVKYRELNDPHYWKAEYFDKSTNHVLACPF